MVVAWTEGVKRTGAKKLTVDCRLESAMCANSCHYWMVTKSTRHKETSNISLFYTAQICGPLKQWHDITF